MKKECLSYNLSFQYEDSEVYALKNVVGQINKGDCTVLCGESGCGKSTFIRIFNRLIPEFYPGNLQGEACLCGKDLNSFTTGTAGEYIASVFQDPRSQFFTSNSSSEVAFGLENFGYLTEEIIDRVNKTFSEAGLIKLKNRNVFELSSGERQMVAILAAKALDAEILLLDEPTANLDFMAIEELTGLLKKLKSEGKTLIISDHRLYYLKNLADRYLLIDDGSIVGDYTAEEMDGFSKEELESKKLRTTDLKTIEPGYINPSLVENKNNLKFEDIIFSYKTGGDRVLNGINLEGKTGEIIGILGSNGSGKTTFGKIITGILKKSSGLITLDGKELSQKDLMNKGFFVMQETEFQFFSNTVINEVYYRRKITEELKKDVEDKLKKLGLWTLRDRHPYSLSGGQMQKLSIILAYFSEKPIVVLDEPTAGLDRESLLKCIDLIKEMRKTKIVLVITHDIELIAGICTRAVDVKDGQIKKEFNPQDSCDLQKLPSYMRETFSIKDNARVLQKKEEDNARRCDYRVKLLFFIASIVIVMNISPELIGMTLIAALIITAYEKNYKECLIGFTGFIVTYGGAYFFPYTVLESIRDFFPRFILLYLACVAVSERGDTSRASSALRSLNVPEKIIMVFIVVMRFLPSMRKDLGMVKTAIKTRGIFRSFKEKILALSEYIEIIIIPMIFRAIRIAETLSASATTRGIDLNREKHSFVKLKFKILDYIILLFISFCIVLGCIL